MSVLNDWDHVVRLVKPSLVETLPSAAAFLDNRQRPASMNWLECFNPPRENQLREVRSRIRLTLRVNARFVELNVGDAKDTAAEYGTTLAFVKKPLPAKDALPEDPSHCEAHGKSPAVVAEILAEVTIVEWHPAVA